jgi:hypothetical protein
MSRHPQTDSPEVNKTQSSQEPFWVKGAEAWIALTIVADVVSALGLVYLFYAALTQQVDRAFGSLFVLTWACALLALTWGTLKRRRGVLRWEWGALIAGLLYGVIEYVALASSLQGIGGGLFALAVAMGIGIFLAIRITRIIAIGILDRHGYWAATPKPTSGDNSFGKIVGALLAVCLLFDVLGMEAIRGQTARDHFSYAQKQQYLQGQYDSKASAAVDDYLRALEQSDDVAVRLAKENLEEWRYVSAPTVLQKLMSVLPAAEDHVAKGILEYLAELHEESQMSVWFAGWYPSGLHIEAAAELAKYSVDPSRPLELRQLAVEGACLLNHGWTASAGLNITDLFALWETSSDPEFAVRPVARWLMLAPPPHLEGLSGRVEACEYLQSWGASVDETIPALEYAAQLPDAKIQAAAQTALTALRSQRP